MHHLQKYLLRLTATIIVIISLLLIIILNPILTYANKTIYNNYIIYHNQPLDPKFTAILDEATTLLQKSELYNKNLKLDICLNDGSSYPALMSAIRGQAFAWGFYNKVVLQGNMNVKENTVELNGYKWNCTQLLAHEMVHCLQFDKLGLFKSNPIANIPTWKWEGYAEYISRQNETQKDYTKNVARLKQQNTNSWEITFEDSTIAPREYYNYWLQVQYWMDVKGMRWEERVVIDDDNDK